MEDESRFFNYREHHDQMRQESEKTRKQRMANPTLVTMKAKLEVSLDGKLTRLREGQRVELPGRIATALIAQGMAVNGIGGIE